MHPSIHSPSSRYLGANHILIAGSHQNSVKLIDKRDFSVSGSVIGLPGAAYCLDFERRHQNNADKIDGAGNGSAGSGVAGGSDYVSGSAIGAGDVTIGVGSGDDVIFLKMIGGG